MEKLKAYLICSVSLMAVFLFGGLLYTAFDEPAAVPAAAEHAAAGFRKSGRIGFRFLPLRAADPPEDNVRSDIPRSSDWTG